ncbi:hypothetical protein AAFC00_004739 [Neodothiora populina]|uniref:Nucleolar 27S pre-rRNA processing Urb2/Npa2 C-terminal domain-containing protein n=1 Tax=Neodothiora populina TaxID=2781224 RepID=A0ABR3P318_9PEZI
MAIDAKIDSASPSLQRLLSLDKTFDTLDQRIDEASRILGLGQNTRKPLHTARHEFVLRWLLDKLAKQHSARQDAKAWSTVYTICGLLPLPVASKILSASSLLSTIARSLAQLFPQLSGSNVPPPTSNTKREESSNGKQGKRKRNASDKQEPLAGQTSQLQSEQDKHATFLSIADLLRLLISRAEHKSGNLSVQNQIRSVLKVDNATSAKLLNHWLSALLQFAPRPDQEISTLDARLLSHSLQTINELLLLQSRPRSTPNHSDAAPPFDALFADNCLLPASLLLTRLRAASQSAPEQTSLIASASHVLERLLAQHLFVPARAAFHFDAGSNAHTKQAAAHTNAHASLPARLESLRCEITGLLQRSAPSQTNISLAACPQAIPDLLDTALRCTPVATPRQKIAESPWINALFGALYSVLPTSPRTSNPEESRVYDQALVEMLKVLLKRKLSLSSELLVNLVEDRSGLNSILESSTRPNFELLATIIAMDSALFTDTKSVLCRTMFTALTKYGRTTSENASGEDFDTRDLMCRSIAVPLMKAFARIRNLSFFILQWLEELHSGFALGESQWYIWTDPALQSSLLSVLEPSLNTSQIVDLVKHCRGPLDDFEVGEAAASSTKLRASAVILNALIGAIHSDSTIDAMQDTLKSLIESAQSIFRRLVTRQTSSTVSLLTFLSRLYLVWLPVWSASKSQVETVAQLDTIVTSPALGRSVSILQQAAPSVEDQHTTESDAAFAFVAVVCDLSRRSLQHDAVEKLLRRVSLLEGSDRVGASGFASARPASFYMAMTQYPHLLEFFSATDRQAVLQNLVPTASRGEPGKQVVAELFMDATLSVGNHAIRDDLFAAISKPYETQVEREASRKLLLHWTTRGLARHQREKILDDAVGELLESDINTLESRSRLALLVTLMHVPNATAKIATDSRLIWQLASAITADRQDSATIDVFEELCNLLFRHIIDTKEQQRSVTFLADISKSVSKLADIKKTLQACAGRYRLLAAFLKITEARLDTTVLSGLPHRSSDTVDGIVKHLYQSLSRDLESDANTDQFKLQGIAEGVKAYVDLPASFIACGGSTASKYSKRILKLISPLSTGSDLVAVSLSVQIQCFVRLTSESMAVDAGAVCDAAGHLLFQELDAKQTEVILTAVATAAASMSDADKLSLAGHLLEGTGGISQISIQKIALVRCLIKSINGEGKDGVVSVSILTRLLELLGDRTVLETHCELVSCLLAILREKPNMVSQHGIEAVIATTIHLSSPAAPLLDVRRGHTVFQGILDITSSLLQHHRPSLSGRYHVIVPLLQRLVSCLFTPTSRASASTNRFKHPAWIDNKQHPLSIKHAQRVSRLLENLCNPPHSNVSRSRGRNDAAHELVDVARKARIQVGQHVQYLLHYVCTLILNGSLGEGMRDALTPGLWAVMDVMEIQADDGKGVKALSAAMNNAERAVLRGMFEDWRRFGSWSG